MNNCNNNNCINNNCSSCRSRSSSSSTSSTTTTNVDLSNDKSRLSINQQPQQQQDNNSNIVDGYNIIDDACGYARIYGYVKKDKNDLLSPFLIEKYEKDADKYWNKFYKHNNNNFFKDRHWLVREFPEFLMKPIDGQKDVKVFEIGCGVGNTTLPLLELNEHLRFVSFDFSAHAVDLLAKEVEANEQYRGRCDSFVFSAVEPAEKLPSCVPFGQCDLVVIIFVLSAMHPDTFGNVVDMCYKTLRPGGKVLIRDYAENDMAQARFEKHASKIGDNFHVRYDGTRAYYFSLEHMEKLYTSGGLFKTEQNVFIEKTVTNRKQKNNMDRRFIQSKFIKI
ncbi:hypothetical protein SAMD00019534_117810 [Acytostelium subglobosum LB1]|uniref:hypothetical protein n=1 Tax=Acytostelium subglobosum LB1 TaxID=1410327 RepID=UPI000644CFFD|nr:hypothetical protein SAMD00019534_117810 [Acytostelium subglobosum LB1]GAM28605.1 hypothetical protein SAMD00019534_117810 [Acytostelium subglobosum LB1]|eukprot:XP_012748383.1 hypothetical protein SAMD00019534_117810 [Acytostelium subglobosum LB1]